MIEMTIEALLDNFTKVQTFIDSRLEELGCSNKAKFQINVAVEEIFVNIANYAYEPNTGMATIQIIDSEDTVIITFIDSGKPYNPLETPAPDITLPPEERSIGGLGIFMVKKITDDMKYEYMDNKNILSITKRIK